MKINSFNNDLYLRKQAADEANAKKNSINRTNSDTTAPAKVNAPTTNNVNKEDILDISVNSKNMYSIKSRIESGFYNQPNVLKVVAEKIITTLNEEV